MHVELVEELPTGRPAPPGGRIHHLHEAAVAAPDDHKVGEAARQAHYHEGWQGCGLGQEQVVDRHHDLLRLEPELHGGLLYGIDGGPIHVRLTGLAQAAVTHMDAKALEEALEGCRAAVHGRSLHHLGRQQAARPQSHSRHGVPPRLFSASQALADTPRR